MGKGQAFLPNWVHFFVGTSSGRCGTKCIPEVPFYNVGTLFPLPLTSIPSRWIQRVLSARYLTTSSVIWIYWGKPVTSIRLAATQVVCQLICYGPFRTQVLFTISSDMPTVNAFWYDSPGALAGAAPALEEGQQKPWQLNPHINTSRLSLLLIHSFGIFFPLL